MRTKVGVLAAGLMSAMVWGCGGGNDVQPSIGSDGGQTDAGSDSGQPDSGTDAGCPFGAPCPVDAGPDAGTDAGTDAGIDAGIDAGPVDAGTDAGTDAGPVDAGTDGGVAVTIPDSAGWTFFQAKDGLGTTGMMGASTDEGGNLWVAGSTSGLFVMRKGATRFEQFGLTDGLHPYGYMPDGSPSDLDPHLEAISVSGGVSGQVFVGYQGKLPPGTPEGQDCEGNWDNAPVPDPAIYKSGDADKVTLSGNGIAVVHYDIFSGPNVVNNETRGREKLCNILKIVYEHGTNNVWFGGNHGFAWGHADFNGDPTCNGEYPGLQTTLNCAGVWEHVHPAINGPAGGTLTGDYRGIALDQTTAHDVWFGGLNRTTRFKFGTDNGDYYKAETGTENDPSNIIDVWPDTIPNTQTKNQPMDDLVSGIVSLPPGPDTDPNSGSILVSSLQHGVRHLSRGGAFLNDITGFDPHITAMAMDPEDGSLWLGHTGFGLGVTQILADGTIRNFQADAFGDASKMAVTDIQIDTFTKIVDTSVKHNRVLITFAPGLDPASQSMAGVVAVHVTQ